MKVFLNHVTAPGSDSLPLIAQDRVWLNDPLIHGSKALRAMGTWILIEDPLVDMI